MTESEAVRIATDYLNHRVGPHPTFAGEPCRHEFRSAAFGSNKRWHIRFKVIIIDDPDSIVDDDTLVIVDNVSGKAYLFNELFG
jgi:hypothetical protein